MILTLFMVFSVLAGMVLPARAVLSRDDNKDVQPMNNMLMSIPAGTDVSMLLNDAEYFYGYFTLCEKLGISVTENE